MKSLKPVGDFLREYARSSLDAFTRLAPARYKHNEKNYDEALKELESAIEMDLSFREARRPHRALVGLSTKETGGEA